MSIEAETLQICTVPLIMNKISDSLVLDDLPDQILLDERINSVYIDGAYDTKHCRKVFSDRQAHAVILSLKPLCSKAN